MKTINSELDVLDFYHADTREQAERNAYKYSDCGYWLKFLPNGIHLGSIVEGSDAEIYTTPLLYPFTEEDLNNTINYIESEAAEAFKDSELQNDIDLYNEMIPYMSPQLTYEQLSELISHDDIMGIVNEYYWKSISGFSFVFIESELQNLVVYFSQPKDLFRPDADYVRDKDYVVFTYPYNEDVGEPEDQTTKYW